MTRDMDAKEIIERVMTAHWDMVACSCWLCQQGRKLKMGARDEYLSHKYGNEAAYPVPQFKQSDE